MLLTFIAKSAEKFPDIKNFIKTLPYMGKGMLGVFVVILIIVLLTVLLNKITTKKK